MTSLLGSGKTFLMFDIIGQSLNPNPSLAFLSLDADLDPPLIHKDLTALQFRMAHLEIASQWKDSQRSISDGMARESLGPGSF